MPLAAVVHDPQHCVHALLDYRLSVPKLIRACSRMLWDLSRAARPGLFLPPPGLGIVSPVAAEVLALAEVWDATQSLPLPLVNRASAEGTHLHSRPCELRPAASGDPSRNASIEPWEVQAHALSQLLRFYVLRLPQYPIDSEHSFELAACGALVKPDDSSDSEGMMRLRLLINKLPVEVRSLLCALLPLLGWMCGVSQMASVGARLHIMLATSTP